MADCTNFPTGHSQNLSDPFENIPHILEAHCVYWPYSHYLYTEEAMECVTEVVVPYLRVNFDGSCSSVEPVFGYGNSATALGFALLLFRSLMQVAVSLK